MAEILKVSSTSDPSATAGALANTIREQGVAEVQAIGPKAVNQAVKAIIIARGYMAPSGVDLVFVPSFVDVTIDEENKTAMRMKVKTRLPYDAKESSVTEQKKGKPTSESLSDEESSPEDNLEGGEEREEETEVDEDTDSEEDILDI